jgi:hypothetical protein
LSTAFLDQVQELQAAVRVLLGDRDHEAQVRLDHLLLGLPRLALALLDHVDDAAVLADLQARLGGEVEDLRAQLSDLPRALLDEVLPALAAERADALHPVRIELVALIVAQELVAGDAVALGEAHQPALVADQLLVDRVELADQRLDAVVVEREGLHVGDDDVLQLGLLLVLGGGVLRAGGLALRPLGLELAQLPVIRRDGVEGLQHARLDLRLHGGERDVVLQVVLVVAALGGRRRLAVLGFLALGELRRVLAVRPGVGRLQIDDVAQEDLALDELVAPDDDRLEGQRALAEARDHRLAAGLDPLGDRDLALTGQELHRAHLAQVHPHGIVGAVGRLLGGGGDRDGARRRDLGDLAALGLLLLALGALLAGGRLVGLLGLDDVDAHLGELRQHVLELVRIGLALGQHLVDLLVGHVAALLGELHHPLDRSIRQVEERPVGLLLGGSVRLVPFRCLRRHDQPIVSWAARCGGP